MRSSGQLAVYKNKSSNLSRLMLLYDAMSGILHPSGLPLSSLFFSKCFLPPAYFLWLQNHHATFTSTMQQMHHALARESPQLQATARNYQSRVIFPNVGAKIWGPFLIDRKSFYQFFSSLAL